MKKIISLALCLLMVLTLFAGCKDEKAETNSNLKNAKEYLIGMYQKGSKDEAMKIETDKDVLSVVTVDGVKYNVEWAVTVTEGASDAVKIAKSDTANCVKIDVPELTETDILFTATATVKDKDGKKETAEFRFKVFGVEVATDTSDVEAILNDAYALAAGASLEGTQTLTGVITSVDTPYSDQYKNVTVTIAIQDFEDKPIKCYRLAGNGAETLAVGDTITVTGTLTNYQGTIEFGQGCTVKNIVKGEGTATDAPADTSKPSTPSKPNTNTKPNTTTKPSTGTTLQLVTNQSKILKDAFKLGKNETTPYIAQLTGKVISVDKPYNEQYGSVTVTIVVSSKSIKCYNMKGTGTDKVKAGDTITVKGVIKNFYYDNDDTTGTVEFTWDDASQTEVVMIKRVAGKEETKKLSVVDSPKVGTAYKFGFKQEQLGKVLYATGTMEGFYMATSDTASVAIDVYLEKATGGYYVYTKIDGQKKYLNIEATPNGQHVNAVFSDKADMVFTYDTAKKTLVTAKELTKKGESSTFVFGTYGTYTTIGASATTHTDTYYCHFYK